MTLEEFILYFRNESFTSEMIGRYELEELYNEGFSNVDTERLKQLKYKKDSECMLYFNALAKVGFEFPKDSTEDSEGNKDRIRDFIKDKGKRPSTISKDLVEKKLGQALTSYTSPSHRSFDPAFKAEIDELCPLKVGGRPKKYLTTI